jgi:hypothetical protein
MMRRLLGPNDWLGRHQGVCLVLLASTLLIVGSL